MVLLSVPRSAPIAAPIRELRATVSHEPAVDSVINIGTRRWLNSKHLSERVSFDVHLPPDYSTNGQRFPVLYVLDGEQYFLPVTAIAEFLAAQGDTPPVIVVGVHTVRREHDLTTPLTGTHKAPAGLGPTGGARVFERFLIEELIPEIDARYRTETFRILAGHSLGGLVVIDIMARAPHVFRGNIALEPSLWWDGRAAVDSLENALRRTPDFRGRLVVVEGPAVVDGWRPSASQIALVAPRTLKISAIDLSGETHESMALRGFYDGLRVLFGDYQPGFRRDATLYSRAALDSQYTALSRELGYTVAVPDAARRAVETRMASDRRLRPSSVPQVARSAADPFIGRWRGVASSSAQDSLRLDVTIEYTGDTLLYKTVITGIKDPAMRFAPAAQYLSVRAPMTVFMTRTDPAGNHYATTLRLVSPDELTGSTVLEPRDPPPRGVNLVTNISLHRVSRSP